MRKVLILTSLRANMLETFSAREGLPEARIEITSNVVILSQR